MSACRYCSDYPKKLIDTSNFDLDIVNETKIIKNKINIEMTSFSEIMGNAFSNYSEVNINYCPMCGRKLEGDKL